MLKQKKTDKTEAGISFVFLLFFWVPLLNVVFTLPASIYFGIKAIRKSRKYPTRYKGFKLAVFSIAASIISLIGSYVYFVLVHLGRITTLNPVNELVWILLSIIAIIIAVFLAVKRKIY